MNKLNKVLVASIMCLACGSAYSADFGVLAAGPASFGGTLDIPAPTATVVSRQVAKKTYDISCRYDDQYEINNVAKLDMVGIYNVFSNDYATLSYKGILTFKEWGVREPKENVVFAIGRDVQNVRYSGVSYPKHFKFKLEWHGLRQNIEWANLIISKEAVSVEKDQYGATIRKFNGALDVSYNDHHGDYVKVVCTQRAFE